MSDVGQSNIDNDLHKQPDQIVDQSNISDEFLDVQPNPNQGEAIDFCESNVLCSDANFDVMGDVGQSNVDDDLHSQPDQNFDHSNRSKWGFSAITALHSACGKYAPHLRNFVSFQRKICCSGN